MNPHAGKTRLEAVGDKRIGDVPAVPSQEKIHSVNSRSSQMRCVANSGGRQDAAAHQFGGESLDLLVEVQKLKPCEQFETFGCLGGFALAGFVEDEL